jgi:hypothetical protein
MNTQTTTSAAASLRLPIQAAPIHRGPSSMALRGSGVAPASIWDDIAGAFSDVTEAVGGFLHDVAEQAIPPILMTVIEGVAAGFHD